MPLGFWIALVICILGLVIYMVAKDGRVQTLARDCFWVGLLVLLLDWAGHWPVNR